MKKYFTRFKTMEPDPTDASWGNVASFYSLLIFLIAIPFVLGCRLFAMMPTKAVMDDTAEAEAAVGSDVEQSGPTEERAAEASA